MKIMVLVEIMHLHLHPNYCFCITGHLIVYDYPPLISREKYYIHSQLSFRDGCASKKTGSHSTFRFYYS